MHNLTLKDGHCIFGFRDLFDINKKLYSFLINHEIASIQMLLPLILSCHCSESHIFRSEILVLAYIYFVLQLMKMTVFTKIAGITLA